MPVNMLRVVVASVLYVASSTAGQVVGPPLEAVPGVRDATRAGAEPDAERRLPSTTNRETLMPLSGGGIKSGGGDAGSTEVVAGGGLGRTLAALAGVVGLIVLLAGIGRRIAKARGGLSAMMGPGGRAPSGVVFVLARYPLGRGQTLIMLKVERRVLLICRSHGRGVMGVGGGAMTTLAEITDPEEVATIVMKMRENDGESIGSRFRSVLGRFDSAHTAAERTPERRVHRPASASVASRRADSPATPMVAPRPPTSARATMPVERTPRELLTPVARVGPVASAASRARPATADRATEALRARLAAARRAA